MKKFYSLIFISTFLLSFNTNGAIINVVVSNFKFTPATFTAVVGDSVVWDFSVSTPHTTTSTTGTVPAGAAPWDSQSKTGPGVKYGYKITVAGGPYGYFCSFHPSQMFGTFNVTPVGINEPFVNLITTVYPNPFNDKVTIKYNGIESIEMFNVVGEKVKSVELSSVQTKAEIDFAGLPAGVYFYRTYREGTIVETRKIVKAN